MAKKFFIETFGCQMNELDSEKIAGSFLHEGMEPVSDHAQADVIILNTCSVRQKAVDKVYARLGELKKYASLESPVVIGVVGCMAQLEGEKILARAPFINILAGPQKGHVMPNLVKQAIETRSHAIDLRMNDDPEPQETTHVLRESPWRAGVTISEGCNRKCAFCVVPITRGEEKNRPSAHIVREVEDLVRNGYLEVVLLGQTVNSYQDPSSEGLDFAGLLERLAGISGMRRIRFTSPHPNEFTERLLEVMIHYPQICNHIHLPVQSGSSRVLRAMRRGYSRERYLRTIRRIRRATRPLAISTDIIVGFPGESGADFEDTLSLLDEVQYDSVFSFKYSPRPHTAAIKLPGEIPEEESRRRLQIVQDQQQLIQYNKNAAHLGDHLEVLVEGKARLHYSLSGRASNNKVVNFDGPESLIGSFVRVEITGFSANSLKGLWIN